MARAIIVTMIAIQVVCSIPNGVKGARQNYVYQAKSAMILKNIKHASDAQVDYYLYLFAKAPFVRSRAQVLEQHHLSLFANEGPNP